MSKAFLERGIIEFPKYRGSRCYMMPVIQGNGRSLPAELQQYAAILDRLYLPGEQGELGYLTIDESEVLAGASQRGYGAGDRTIHTEACLSGDITSWGVSEPSWGSTPTWGDESEAVFIDRSLRAIIANSVDDTCMVWDAEVFDTTPDGDLSHIAGRFPRSEGRLLKAGELIEIGIFTPHECIKQQKASCRQFLRLVGNGVHGRAPYFTDNPSLK